MDDAPFDAAPARTRKHTTVIAGGVWLAGVLLLLTLLVLVGVLPFTSGLYAWPLAWGALTLALAFTRVGPGVLIAASSLAGVALFGMLVAINFKAVRVEGASMDPTFKSGDVLLVDVTARPAGRFEVHVLGPVDNPKSHVVKRVVGLPGEVMDARYGRVFADGEEVYPRDGSASDTWYRERPAHARFYSGPRELGEDEFFVLGDNPPDSRDSRHFGAVSDDKFEGRVVWSLRGSRGFGRVE